MYAFLFFCFYPHSYPGNELKIYGKDEIKEERKSVHNKNALYMYKHQII